MPISRLKLVFNFWQISRKLFFHIGVSVLQSAYLIDCIIKEALVLLVQNISNRKIRNICHTKLKLKGFEVTTLVRFSTVNSDGHDIADFPLPLCQQIQCFLVELAEVLKYIFRIWKRTHIWMKFFCQFAVFKNYGGLVGFREQVSAFFSRKYFVSCCRRYHPLS